MCVIFKGNLNWNSRRRYEKWAVGGAGEGDRGWGIEEGEKEEFNVGNVRGIHSYIHKT